ncbi:LuxR C-terminal-related transcriptional regulator [Castellaniella sp.]|uniref:LuxR C-terminal-related transcriptional regulator n=1 Tax=Castellaniella sp. TaxID=1955812 RepID=UPI00355EB3DE
MHPRLMPGSIERTRLLEQLKLARHKTCFLIHGPAGSGKTSLALQWRALAMALGQHVAWLAVQSRDDRQNLLDDLFDALDAINPDLSREARLLYNRGTAVRADAIALALLRALMASGQPLTLILDDWQNISEMQGNTALQTLLDFAPANLRVVIVSRTLPRISLARLRDQGALEEVGPADLRFTLDEVRALMQSRRADHDTVDARELLELTDGWAAGLRLMAWQPRAPSAPVQNAHDFTAYFNREVLCHLAPEEIGLMCRLAMASGFNASLASALAGDERGPELLERLRTENLFVNPQTRNQDDAWFAFHPLFRELLRDRFLALDADQQHHAHLTLARWFGERRHLRDAVFHALAADDVTQAVQWVECWARELFLAGELQELARAVSQLPRTALHHHPALLLWRGWTQLCYHEFSACHETLDLLQNQLAGVGSAVRDAQAHRLLLAFSLALQEESLDTAQALLPEMMSLRQGADAVLIGGRRNLLGWLHTHLAQYDKAREFLQGPAPLLEDGKPLLASAFGHVMTQSLHGLSWLFEGNVRQAEPILREALAQAEAALGPYSESACNAAAYLSAVLYEINELEAFDNLLEGRLDAIERVVLPDALVTVTLAYARRRRKAGNPLEALESLERLEDMASRRAQVRLLAFALSERLRCLLAMQDWRNATDTLQQLLLLSGRHAGMDGAGSRRILGLARYATALHDIASGDDRAALRQLSSTQGKPCFGQDIHGVRLHQALLSDRLGHSRQALDMLYATLLRCQSFGLVRTVLDMGPPLLDLVHRCAACHLDQDPLPGYYLDQLLAQAARSQGTPTARQPTLTEPLSERELEVLTALSYSMSNKRIAQVLGVSPETVKWHLRNIYGKLGVSGRDDAVARARDLKLLDDRIL